MSAIHAILSNPEYRDYLAILKGARNGLVYGVKVRFPHALIMAILFGRGEYVSFSGTGIPCSFHHFNIYLEALIVTVQLVDATQSHFPRDEATRDESLPIRRDI
jgi:hypothetical protein